MNFLSDLLQAYQNSVDILEEAKQVQETEVLNFLYARDQIAAAFSDVPGPTPVDRLRIIELDKRLRALAPKIAEGVPLPDWRTSFAPPATAWWWYLEPLGLPAKKQSDLWLWEAIALVCTAVSASLVLDIAPRFLSGGPDTLGALAVIVQTLLTAISAGGVLTKYGRNVFEQTVENLKVPPSRLGLSKAFAALAVVIFLVGLRLLLPSIAILYNNNGLANYLDGRYASAKFDYIRALKLNPDYPVAHYNLGLLYEDLQEFSLARSEYQLALLGGLDAAYNNLARLYILEGQYASAVPILLKGQNLAADKEIRFSLLKNLGWARFGQQRYSEAETILIEAIHIDANQAPAYCLLAQVLEAQLRAAQAKPNWENCLIYASEQDIDEDLWIHLARQRLAVEGGND